MKVIKIEKQVDNKVILPNYAIVLHYCNFYSQYRQIMHAIVLYYCNIYSRDRQIMHLPVFYKLW